MDGRKEYDLTMRMMVGDFNENHGPDGRFSSGMGGVDLQSALENGQQEEALKALSGIEVGGAVYSSGGAFVKTGKDKFREMTMRHGGGRERSYNDPCFFVCIIILLFYYVIRGM